MAYRDDTGLGLKFEYIKPQEFQPYVRDRHGILIKVIEQI